MVRCVRAAAKRIGDNKGITEEMRQSYRRGSSRKALKVVLDSSSASIKNLRLSTTVSEPFSALMRTEITEDKDRQHEESSTIYEKQNAEVLAFMRDISIDMNNERMYELAKH